MKILSICECIIPLISQCKMALSYIPSKIVSKTSDSDSDGPDKYIPMPLQWSDEACGSPNSISKIDNFVNEFRSVSNLKRYDMYRCIAVFAIGFEPKQRDIVCNFSMFILEKSTEFTLVNVFYADKTNKSINNFNELIKKYDIQHFFYNSHAKYDIVQHFANHIPYLKYIQTKEYTNLRWNVRSSVEYKVNCIINHSDGGGCSFCCCLSLLDKRHNIERQNRRRHNLKRHCLERRQFHNEMEELFKKFGPNVIGNSAIFKNYKLFSK